MVNLARVSKIHKKYMYHDKCDIYEYESKKNANGSVSTTKSKIPKYMNVPCKISFSERTWDTFHHTDMDTTPYQKQPKIFMEVEYLIKPGYYVEARRYKPGTKELIGEYKGECGLPQVSWTHQEVLLDCRGYC